MKALKTTFNRAKQTLDEQLGDAKKTELEADTTRLLQKADDIKLSTEKILLAMEIYLQPDPAERLLPGGFTGESPPKAGAVGIEMSQLAAKLGGGANSDPYASAMLAAGEAYTKLGQFDKEFMKGANEVYITPMRKFVQNDLKQLDTERKTLNNKRLDMDALRAKATKPDAPPATQQEFAKTQEAFNEQLAVVKSLIEKIETQLPDLKNHLKRLIERHADYLKKCQETLASVQTKL